MKKAFLVSAMATLAGWGTFASAQEVGRVISSTPVIQQVAVPRQVCSNQPMVVQQPNTGAGAVMGGIAGGAMGNAIGGGSGRAAATVLGLVGGALLGNNIEGSGGRVANVQQCATETTYENRTVGYNVAYEYGGKQYNVQMPYDPGPTIRVQVTPVGSNEAPPAEPGYGNPPGTPLGVIVGPPMGQPMVAAPPPVVYAPPYPAYYYPQPYYYPPVGLSLNFGYSNHRHWR